MLYPVYIHIGDAQHAHGMQFPDFPGCFSAADDWQDIPRMAQEAVECHMAGENLPLPDATSLEKLANHPGYMEGIWMLVDIDVSRIDPTPQRINVSIPRNLLTEIDAYASSRGATRSGFLAEAARAAMQR
ncbi:MAG: type II toxin-antitoxin system HicB family antitoxin [Methylobacillus sp.]|nr:type II toxin-antitoxin system HicB family antitoxin [Methylobacillus sp.]